MTILRASRGRWAAAVALALAAALVGLSGTTVFAATKTPWNTNLVKNPGFEAGAASSDGYAVVAIPSWHNGGSSNAGTVVRYGQAGWPTLHEGNRINGGHKFWASGLYNSGECPSVFQRIAIKGRNTAIDSGNVGVFLTVWLATYDSQIEQVAVSLTFRTAAPYYYDLGAGTVVSAYQTQSVFVKRSTSVYVPVQTRFIDIKIHSSAHEGDYCDAYADKVNVKIKQL